jgi:hypothetical protein
MEASGGHALARRAVHGYVTAQLKMTHGYTRIEQRSLKCETTAEQKGYEIISPQIRYFGSLFG